ncbi:outer membrane chaperone Skp (OmpH) [Melioribacter roseus P3M-2]|jgi:outer membrane protein|uniref:Outer membrane chaperone Skp (OmpH) n=1 Tax=Melioribacter roseus (strain DSM 23840 / JCM 17771 / VKM B-2668 / P3M-2) TaxID=1191523 RepID=I6Z7H6_MELRP|nr:OmpH family outer membrane protein [Melioribacter roseus]AFN75115.1 outer membrane chaperone Skp (OmpH) [Melioribacter roseus P3M-2]
MKKILLLILAFSTVSFAQLKIGYVDSEAIMSQLPEAQDAQKKLDAIIKEWQEELNKMEKDWKTKYEDYEKRKLILSEQKRVEIEKELVQLEEQISKFRQEKFGVRGELFQKKEELDKPILNRIFNAIEEVAKENDFDFIFDKSGDIMFLYAKEEYDVTNLVLEKLK